MPLLASLTNKTQNHTRMKDVCTHKRYTCLHILYVNRQNGHRVCWHGAAERPADAVTDTDPSLVIFYLSVPVEQTQTGPWSNLELRDCSNNFLNNSTERALKTTGHFKL